MSWSHFRELLPLNKPLQREFYAEMCRIERWDVRSLRTKIDGMLYERTALSKKPDELGSGMRKMMTYSRAYGGADPELVEGDVFRMTVKVPEFGERAEPVTPEATDQVGAQSGAQSEKILLALSVKPLSSQEIAQILGMSSKSGALKRCLKELLEGSLIEYTIPDKPNSRLQKYRLTATGKRLTQREGTGHGE